MDEQAKHPRGSHRGCHSKVGVRNYFSVGKGIGAREEGCGVKTSRDVRNDGTLPV